MKTNLTKKIVGLLVSLSMMLAYAVPFAFAEGGIADETLWTFESLFAGEKVTLSADTDIDGLTIHATGERTVDIDGSNKTIEEERFSVRAKLIGKTDSAMSYRSLSFLPELDGTVTVYYAHASSSGDPRVISVVQGDVRADDSVEQGTTKAFTTAVTGGTEVFIGSFEHNLNVYGVKYVPGGEAPTPDEPTATDEPSATAQPGFDAPVVTEEPTVTDEPSNEWVAVTESRDWVFSDYADVDVTKEVLIADGTMKIFGDEKMTIDGSNKNIDDIQYSMRLKMGGSAVIGEDGIPKTKAISLIPGTEGAVKVAFAHASGSGTTRTLLITQGGEQIGSIGVEPGNTEFIKVAVKAGEPVYIYSLDGLNFYGVHFVAGETVEPTTAPTTAPTTEPTATPAPGETTEPTTAPTAAPDPTDAPATELVAVTESAGWIFADYSDVDVTKDVLIADGTMKIFGDSKMTIDGSNKKIDDIQYSMRLKTGGAATFDADGVPKTRAMSILPGTNGILKVAFAHASGSGSDPRTLIVAQDGLEIETLAVEGGNTAVLETEVEAGYPVYIYARDGVNYYAVYFEVSAPVDPNATPDPEAGLKDLREAQADADALTLRSISDYAVYIDLELVKKGAINKSDITWESSNEDYISIQDGVSSGGNYTGVVTRPTSDEEIDENGGVPVTLTATVTNGDAVVTREFEVSVRKFEPLYFNNFQADVGVPADEENGYLGIQDSVVAANGETFKGIRVSALKNAKSIIDYGFEHNDYDIEKNFDKRIMETSKYGQSADPYGKLVDENYAFYYSEWKAYGGGTTQMPIWIRLADDTTSGYPEGIVVMSMDINIVSNGGQFSMGIGTSKPAQMCRFMLNKGGLRYFNEADTVNYKEDEYDIPMQKWMTVTIVANTSTHLWDLYFDGILVQKNVRFRNAQDYAPTIEFTISRDSSKDAVLIDNIWVENITDDYNQSYWDDLELELPYDEEKAAYVANDSFFLYYNGLEGLAGNTYLWKSRNEDIIDISTKSYAVDELAELGYSEEQIQAYKDKGAEYVTLTVAEPVMKNIPEEGAYATLVGSMEIGEKSYSKEFKVYVTKSGAVEEPQTDSEKALADLNAITSVKGGTTYTKNENLDLEDTGALYGSQISWKSSNTKVISNSGKITRPKTSGITTVTLTATAVYGEAEEIKKFTVYVKGTGSSGSGGGGGGGGGSYGGSSLRVVGTVTDAQDEYETNALTPEQTSQMIFNDIEIVPWAKEAIEALYNEGVVSGYGNDLFAPNYSVTREQFVKMIVEALDLSSDADTELSFSDVAADAWYAPYIKVAVALGIVTGKDDVTFGVGESITRQDMAVMCVRALNATGIELDGAADLADSATISDYAKDAVSKMVAAGYITGDENGNFNPLDTATRAQTAVVLYRIIK